MNNFNESAYELYVAGKNYIMVAEANLAMDAELDGAKNKHGIFQKYWHGLSPRAHIADPYDFESTSPEAACFWSAAIGVSELMRDRLVEFAEKNGIVIQ